MAKYVQRNNVDTLNLLRDIGSVDYQRRIPNADKGNIQDIAHNLFRMNLVKNEFIDGLVNRIGREYVVFKSWRNKLAVFKGDPMMFGDTMEETGVGLTKANRFDPSANALEGAIFGQHRPNTRTAFHRVNRMDRYDITVNETMLRRAFLTPNGLSNLVAQLMESPITSDNYDEYLMMTRLFREMYDVGAFWKVRVPDVRSISSDAPDAKYLLREMRSWADILSFPSAHYNLAKLETFVEPEKIVLFVTPESKAAIDVEALAAAYNLSYAELSARTITVRTEDVNIPGFQAALTTEEFFKVVDTLITTTSADNPVGLYQNFFLHHHGIISASPMAPFILFTSAEDSDVIELTPTPVESVEIHVEDLDGNTVASVTRGLFYRVVGTAITNPTGGDNSAVRLALEPGTSSTFTYLRQVGEFSIGLDEDATSIKIDAFATDTEYPQIKATATVTVTGAKAVFPPAGVDEDADGLIEVTPENLVVAEDNSVTIPSVKGVQYLKAGTPVNNGSSSVITAATTYTAQARAGYELATGATASWNLSPHA